MFLPCMTNLPTLPTEVWERVIDWLVVGYTQTSGGMYHNDINFRRDLSRCAVVCRAWRVRTQMHLFAFLRISGKGLSQYKVLILKTPILCDFAKDFHFYNEYVETSENRISHQTVETASHVVRIAHKLPYC